MGQGCQRAGETLREGRRAWWTAVTACAKALGQEGARNSRHYTKSRLCHEQSKEQVQSGQGWVPPGPESQVQSLSQGNWEVANTMRLSQCPQSSLQLQTVVGNAHLIIYPSVQREVTLGVLWVHSMFNLTSPRQAS